MTEWVVDCGRDLAAAEVRLAANITYLDLGAMGVNMTESSQELVFALIFLVKGSGVGDMAVVLVQGLLDECQVLLLECLFPILDELDLWRDGHCDGATGG